MGLRPRLHVNSGFYYLSRRCAEGKQLFSTEEHYSDFAAFLAAKVRQLHMHIHAYCWLPNEIYLLVEVDHIPASKLMQAIGNHLAHRFRPGSTGTLFPNRYHALLIEPDNYLLKAIRDIHWRSVDPHSAETLNGYEHSSHPCYLGLVNTPWLTTHTALNIFNQHTELARPSYSTFMQMRPTEQEAQIFGSGPRREPRVLGSTLFCRKVGFGIGVSLEDFAESIARRMGYKIADVCSRSRHQELSRVRAVIAWHATRRKVATLVEVSRYLGDRKPPSLCSAVKYYRQTEPELFNLRSLPCEGPIVSTSMVHAQAFNTDAN